MNAADFMIQPKKHAASEVGNIELNYGLRRP